MDKKDIELVQNSMKALLHNAATLGERLYENLFSIAPHLRPLFMSDIASQSRKLMSILIHITANLGQLETLKKELSDLAIRHKYYNVLPEHYNLLGRALLRTLEESLGSHWNEATAIAWQKAYDIIANEMIIVQQQYVKENK